MPDLDSQVQEGASTWRAAARRADLIGRYSPSYGQDIEAHRSEMLLSVLLYACGDDLEAVTAAVVEATEDQGTYAQRLGRVKTLHSRVSARLCEAGHDLDLSPGEQPRDPVVAAWAPLDTVPADTPASMSEFPEWMVAPQGSTSLGTALTTVRSWLRAQANVHTPARTGDRTETAELLRIVVPANDAVQALAEVYAPVLHAWRHQLTPVDVEHLHLTLGLVEGDITPEQRQQLGDALARQLAAVEPCTLVIGRAQLMPGRVALDVLTDAVVSNLAVKTHTALREVLGFDAPVSPWDEAMAPQITLAHIDAADGDARIGVDLARCRDRRDNRILGGHRPSPVELPVNEIHLLTDGATVPIRTVTPHTDPVP